MGKHNTLTADEAADSLHAVARALASGRAAGEGPEFLKRRSEFLHALSAIERLIASIEADHIELPKPVAADDDSIELLTADEAAKVLRASAATLARWRTQGCGPEYVKRRGRVLYTPAALEAFAAGNTRTKTRPEH